MVKSEPEDLLETEGDFLQEVSRWLAEEEKLDEVRQNRLREVGCASLEAVEDIFASPETGVSDWGEYYDEPPYPRGEKATVFLGRRTKAAKRLSLREIWTELMRNPDRPVRNFRKGSSSRKAKAVRPRVAISKKTRTVRPQPYVAPPIAESLRNFKIPRRQFPAPGEDEPSDEKTYGGNADRKPSQPTRSRFGLNLERFPPGRRKRFAGSFRTSPGDTRRRPKEPRREMVEDGSESEEDDSEFTLLLSEDDEPVVEPPDDAVTELPIKSGEVRGSSGIMIDEIDLVSDDDSSEDVVQI